MLSDKGLFLNDLRLHTTAEWVEYCVSVGAHWVALKLDAAMNNGRRLPLALALEARGIQVAAWQYIVPTNPRASAAIAIRECAELELGLGHSVAAFFVDAEGPYNLPSNLDDAAASAYMTTLREGLGAVPIGLCSYRYPSYQTNFPWMAFLARSDFHSPQVYWVQAHNPAYQLRKSIAELQAIKRLPMIPVGAAYSEHGWKAAASEVEEFLDAALDAACPAVALWYGDEMFDTTSFHFRGSTVADRKAWCAAFRAAWPETPPPEPPDTPLFMDLPEPLRWGMVEAHLRRAGEVSPEGHPLG
jgi:hypothetical protein